jgi:hypothetical protein
MPQTVQYRLTIRTASTLAAPNPTTNLLVVTSIAGGTGPYIAAPPQGDGVEIDPLMGTTRSGAYVIEVVDANTGTDGTGTLRVVTNTLEDATFRQQMISRRAKVEVLRDNVPSPLIDGFVTSVRLVSPMRYAITIGDSRRQERTQTIFQGAALGSYTTRGTITGGPITGTADFGTVKPRGGWKYRVTVNGDDVSLEFQSGYEPAQNSPVVTDWSKVNREEIGQIISARRQVNPYALLGGGSQFVTSYTTPVYDFTTADWVVGGGIQAVIGNTTTNAVPVRALVCGFSQTPTNEALGVSTLYLYWPGCPYATGSSVYVSLNTVEVSDECPLYIDAHPVDIVTAIWTNARILYDPAAAWVAAMRSLIGDTVRLALRFDKAPLMDEFLPQAIYGPFGVAERVNSAGLLELVPTRIRTTTAPSLTITGSSLRGADEVVFDLDESTAVSAITLTQQVLSPTFYNAPNRNNSVQSSQTSGPVNGVTVQTITQTAQYMDASLAVFSGKTIAYNVPGMIHTSADFVPNTQTQLDAMAVGTFDRFGRGCPSAEVAILATDAAAAALVGDEVYLEAPHYPNKGYRIGESTVGARIMQVVRRTETPSGPMLRLLDSGLAAQPVAPPVTITVAQSPTAPSSIARFTVTNAAAINATGVLQVRVEQATGTVTPTGNGADFALYTAGQVPTTGVDLAPVITPGVTQYVRARTEQPGRRPSAWSAWAAVTLSNLPTVTGLTASAIRQTAATITWANTSTSLPLAIFANQGIGIPANSAPFRVATVPAGSTSTIVRSLTGPSVAWTLGVAYESAQVVGPIATVSLTTNSTLDTPTRPAGIAIIPGVDDATLTQGIALALWASDQSLDIRIERSTTSGSGFVTIATVAGSTPVYVDQLPRDGTTYYYRIAHVLGGFTVSAYTPEVSAIARGVPPGVERPGAVTPVVQVATSEVGTTATVTLTITDPQSRVAEVRFRERTNGGAWSAWTIDTTIPYSYSATIPGTGFVQIEYEVSGFDAAGTALQVLAGGVESFDADSSASMVSVVGTFTASATMLLAISADSDTQSIRFAHSTAGQPTLATTQAATAINGRNYATTLSGPYPVGTTVFVSVLGYTGLSGGGLESVLFQYRFVRDNTGIVYSQCLATLAASSATQIVVTVFGTATTGSPTVQLMAPLAGSATLAAGAAPGVPVASGSQWTFNRGAALGQPGGAQFRAVLAGTVSDDDFIEVPEQGRDTTYLTSRARVLSTSNTQVVVRYAVIDKYSPLSCSMSYTSTGVGSITPSTPQTVTAAVADQFPTPPSDEVAGSFVDFTIQRPSFQAGNGGVTFQVTNASRVSDTDFVVVPAVEQDTIALSARARVTSTDSTTQVVRVAVADPQPATVIASITGSTVTTSAPHNQSGTFTVIISGNSNGAYNGTWTATVLSATTFSISTSSTTGTGGSAAPQNYATIGFSTTGLATPTQVGGAALPSPVTVTPQTSLTEAAGTFFDFQITRPASGQPPGRINFTVTAGGRAPATQAATVVAQDIVAPSLDVVVTPGATTYTIVVTSTGTMSYQINGGSVIAGTGSPQTIVATRPAVGSNPNVYAFRAVRDGITTNGTAAVPALEPANVTITAFSIVFDFTNNYVEYNYTLTGLPTSYDIKCFAFIDGLATGELIEVSSTSTKTIVGSPIPIDPTGSITNNWELFFEVTDDAFSVLATSISKFESTYQP